MTIRNPVEWSADHFELSAQALKSIGHAFWRPDIDASMPQPRIERISVADLKDVLRSGLRDFAAYRTDVLFLCLIYPLIGIVLASVTLHFGLWPLLFPLVSGFALIGPFAAAGLYEMSRRQEQGKPVSWGNAFAVFASPAFAEIIKLGLVLVGIFLLWLAIAMGLYRFTLGPAMPTSLHSFETELFSTAPGWTMIIAGIGIDLVFALVVLAISVVSFPLLLDRPVNVATAVQTSVRTMMLNPVPILVWGLIVAGSLFLGAIPALAGLIVVIPILGHATWHLYRKVIYPGAGASPS
jgi:uncharacterized membrane protein